MSKYVSKITLTVAIIILFVPTIIAFIYINAAEKDTPVPVDDAVVTMFVSNTDGSGETEITDRAAVAGMTNDINTAEAIIDTSALPLADSDSYLLTVRTSKAGDAPKTYTLYMTKDSSACFFRKETGAVFRISPAVAEAILKMEVCQKALTYVEVPEAIYGYQTRTALAPYKTYWKYINTLGETAEINESGSAVASVTLKPDVSVPEVLTFGSVIDSAGRAHSPREVYITPSIGETVYDKTLLSEIDAFIKGRKLKSDTHITFDVEVDWGTEDLTLGFCGTVSYMLDVFYDLPTTFEISNATVYAGTLPLLRARNLNYGRDLSVEVKDPDGEAYAAYDVTFHPYESVYIAFLPFDIKAKPGRYTVTVKEDGEGTDLFVNVKERSVGTKSLTYPAKTVSENYGESKKTSFMMTMENVFANTVEEKLWDGAFAAPVKIKLAREVTYGQTVKINTEYDEVARCTTYIAAEGTEVVATNNGKVVYAGQTAITGKTVVIEHGFGCKSWYFNLDEVTVSVGDEVKKSDKLGAVGKTGFATGQNFVVSYAFSIGEVFINPELYLNNKMDYFDKNK